MYIHIDVSKVPPAIEVREQENFTQFKVVLSAPEHVHLQPESLVELAGRSADPAWNEQFAGMVSYAASKGWVDAQGGVRAHIEIQRAGETSEPGFEQTPPAAPKEH